jgi:hypothetical protein
MATPCGKKTDAFIRYLTGTLIPDLRSSGREATADDFEEAIGHIENCCAKSRGRFSGHKRGHKKRCKITRAKNGKLVRSGCGKGRL